MLRGLTAAAIVMLENIRLVSQLVAAGAAVLILELGLTLFILA